jgi:hypothetical protein
MLNIFSLLDRHVRSLFTLSIYAIANTPKLDTRTNMQIGLTMSSRSQLKERKLSFFATQVPYRRQISPQRRDCTEHWWRGLAKEPSRPGLPSRAKFWNGSQAVLFFRLHENVLRSRRPRCSRQQIC